MFSSGFAQEGEVKQFDFHQFSQISGRFFIESANYTSVLYVAMLCVSTDITIAWNIVWEGISNLFTTSLKLLFFPTRL